ncbi:hypothetical protein [Caldalkalibacillus thermarum]|uniref:hypothetical protein n=1 Tax=Caldalkalibacillus thermarum TaxID=296745 RepID=UPI001E3747BD|nr:hypothetical protein [Caldalkalibacillus thermarum]
MKLYVGIDVNSHELATCIMDHEGNTCARFKVDNRLLGATFLRDQILLWANKAPTIRNSHRDGSHLGLQLASGDIFPLSGCFASLECQGVSAQVHPSFFVIKS